MNSTLISIRSQHVRNIFLGIKTVELRRIAPDLGKGDIMFIYETFPVQAVVGFAVVSEVVQASRIDLWHRVKGSACVTKRDFYSYFRGGKTANAIVFRE